MPRSKTVSSTLREIQLGDCALHVQMQDGRLQVTCDYATRDQTGTVVSRSRAVPVPATQETLSALNTVLSVAVDHAMDVEGFDS